jgi:glycosyltransferase involved in cell wall biosynthesis
LEKGLDCRDEQQETGRALPLSLEGPVTQRPATVISVAVSTFNRPAKVSRLVEALLNQTVARDQYEIIVVDNGSAAPICLPEAFDGAGYRLLRFEQNIGRCRARSAAVDAASGEFVLFLDDDLIVKSDLLEQHLRAQREWPDVLAIGKIILPPARLIEPGVRFRQDLELRGIPTTRGLVEAPNFGTAANVSIRRMLYLEMGGFDPAMDGIEDQDFAMRHSAQGGRIAFLPEAGVVHDDDWMDFFSFCERQERGMEWTVAFSRRYPSWKDSIARHSVNGPLRLGSEGALLSAKKMLKAVLGTRIGGRLLRALVALLEHLAPGSRLLTRAYEMTLGTHLLRGYRRGLARFGADVSR